MRSSYKTAALLAAALAFIGPEASAEVREVVLGEQFGAVFLPVMVMEHEKLVEKELAAAGLSDVKVTWTKLGGPAALNDAMIAGSLHFAAQGAPSMAIIWDRTRGSVAVKSLGAIANNNIWLNTKNPSVKSIADFTDKDRIAIPSLKVATQALLLQIAAEQRWGKGNHTRLDQFVVALAHPDAFAAVTNPSHEITAHFATSPFHEAEMKAGLRTITSAYEIMGGPMTGLTFTSSEAFRNANPRVFAAVSAAFDKSFGWISDDRNRAARMYIEMTKEKRLGEAELAALFASPDMEYTKVPSRVGKMVEFMQAVGVIKAKAQSWKDLFFPEAHGLPGS